MCVTSSQVAYVTESQAEIGVLVEIKWAKIEEIALTKMQTKLPVEGLSAFYF